ncbi:MAG: TIR domain-containing protein [Oscillospiraceae bacterium]
MAAFICRFCGAALELSDSRVCECESCGRLQSVPLLDSTEKAELFKRAEQLRAEFRYDKAIELFEKMLRLSPTDADLYWALALCRFGVGFFPDGGIALNRTQAHSFLTDNDYRQALNFADKKQREFMEQTAERVDEKRREIAELAATEKYEVYLCCRENNQNGFVAEEVKHAAELYRRLSDEKIRVFYPRVTLEDKAGSEWEPYIFGALNSARVMLIVGVNEDSFEDTWVRNAWSRFVSGDMSGKAVIPLLYGASARELPAELSRFQAIDTSILGFEQDLIFSIKSLLSGKVSEEIPSENSPLVRRAYIYLEDGEWENAENICKRLEQTQPADAALVRLLIEYRLKSEDELDGLFADIMKSENYRAAMQTGSEAFRLRLKKHAVCAQYNFYTAVLNKASDAETCLTAANGFAQLGDYKDSAELASKANQKAAEFKPPTKSEYNLDISDEVLSVNVKPIKKRFFTPLKTGLLVGGICAAALGAVLICNFSGKSSSDNIAANVNADERAQSFERGKALFDEGKYAEAEAVFVSLGNYGNSKTWVNECRYMQAEQLFSDGDFEKARGIFERLGSHNNSQNRVSDCDYALADALEKQGELEAAAEAFEALGTYSDAKERNNNCRYRLAVSLLEIGDDKAAEKIFGELGNFSDSKEQICKIKYLRAEKLFEKKEFSAANELFSALGDYSDSVDRAKEAKYQQALLLIENENSREAIGLLSELGDYKDSAELMNAAWLEYALGLIDARDKGGAYDILVKKLYDYAPAQPYIASLRNEILSGAGWSNSILLGEYYHYKSKDKVSWKVLKTSGNMALVVSENALDYLPFDVNGGSSWAGSSLRAWLNGDFYNSVFSNAEKSLIVSANNGGVTDKIFLLSYNEAMELRGDLVSPDRTYGTIYAQDKIPKGVSEVYAWGRDGLLGRKKTAAGYERLSASPTEPQFVFPAMWVKIN